MVQLKKAFKTFTNILIIASFILQVYIHTYPSLTPDVCSWDNKEETKLSNKYKDIFKVNYPPENQILHLLKLDTWKTYFKDVLLTKKDNSHNKYINPRFLLFGDPQIKGAWRKTPLLTRLDIFGNDHYLGHIFKTMFKRLTPDFGIVMGDLFSSQWIPDDEFYNRTERYINRVFPGAIPSSLERVRDLKKKFVNPDDGINYKTDWITFSDGKIRTLRKEEGFPPFKFDYGSDVYKWNENDPFLFINMTGNHDIGYSGDMTFQHLSRFTDMFGADNFVLHYNEGRGNSYRIVNLNTMLLEGPGLENVLMDITWEFLYQLFEEQFDGTTILLQHIPMFKEKGFCKDGPHFSFYPEVYEKEPYKSNLLKSQNHLSLETSNKLLNLLFHNGKPGIILTGHDHYGCDVVYNRYMTKMKDHPNGLAESYWTASKTPDSKNENSEFTGDIVKEITVRSMMGDFAGAVGLLEMNYNKDYETFDFNYKECVFAVQHIWWAANIVTIITVLLLSIRILFI
ncbi:hypothetical protein ACO0SA_004453 [Hanseniaspora valbyensis]